MKPILQIFNTRFVSLYILWQVTKLTGNISVFQQIKHLFISIPRQKKFSEMHLIFNVHISKTTSFNSVFE